MANFIIGAEGIKVEDNNSSSSLVILPAANEDVTLTAPTTSGTIARNEDLINKADLVGNKVPSSQLPAYVDEILEGEYIDTTTFNDLSSVPYTPSSDKIYFDNIGATGLLYRWSGSEYVVISQSLAIGETSSTAYRGDRGKTAYEHTFLTNNPHSVTKAQVGLGDVDNTPDMGKPISNATQNALDTKLDKLATFLSVSSNRTLLNTDVYKTLVVDNSVDVTITIPPDVFTEGQWINFIVKGLGKIVFSPGIGVTILSADNALETRARYSAVTLLKDSVSNTFYLYGDLTVSV